MEILPEVGNIWETNGDVSLYLVFGQNGMGLNLAQPFEDLRVAFEQEQPVQLNGKTYFLIDSGCESVEDLRVTISSFLNFARENNHKHVVTNGVNDCLQPSPAALNLQEHYRRQFERAWQIAAIVKSWDTAYNKDGKIKTMRLRSKDNDFVEFLVPFIG